MSAASIEFGRAGDQFWLRSQQWLARPLAEVFPFFSAAANLDRITPAWLRFEILSPQPIRMQVGTRIDYRLRLRGVPLRWQSEITVWEPPRRFVDEQRRGPYRSWWHEHLFREQNGGTWVLDNVRYALFGGVWLNRLFVQRDVRRIFQYRQEQLAELLA